MTILKAIVALAWGWHELLNLDQTMSNRYMRRKMLRGKRQQDGIVGSSELSDLIYKRWTPVEDLIFMELA